MLYLILKMKGKKYLGFVFEDEEQPFRFAFSSAKVLQKTRKDLKRHSVVQPY